MLVPYPYGMTPNDPLRPRAQATPSSPRLALVELVYDLRFRTDQAWYFPFLAPLAAMASPSPVRPRD